MPKTYNSNSEAETIEIGREFAEVLRIGDTIGFEGDLGAGKTEFVKGVCNYLKVKDIITSPTFSIINHYLGDFNGEKIDVSHVDLYRIEKPEELDEIGFDELVYNKHSIKMIEWFENAGERLPELDYTVNIKLSDEHIDKRTIIITKNNKKKNKK